MRTLFNDNWFFHKEPLDTETDVFFQTDDWQPVDIPHDWMIYDSADLYCQAVSCYKKTFHVPRLENGRRLAVLFDGVYMDNTIYLNGEEIFQWPNGYSRFEVDLTDYIREGENTLYVKNVYRLPNSRWYPGSGIYRNVWLIERPAVYLPTDGSYLSSECKKDTWNLHVDTEIQNTKGPVSVTIRRTIKDADGAVLACDKKDCPIPAGLTVDKHLFEGLTPKLWDIHSPYLYEVETELITEGTVTDKITQKFGFRSLRFDCDKGFFLNGVNTKINGSCEHHTLGSLGAAMHKEALLRQLISLRDMGVNAIRSAHNMPSEELLDLCDEMGFLLFTESFDMWERCKTDFDYGNFFPKWWQKDLTSWVRQNRSHPCVFIWGIGNEIHDTNFERGLTITRMLRDAVRELDYYENAVIALGSNVMGGEGAQNCAAEVDLAGYNYAEILYDEHHEKYPDWCIFGSETSSTLQSRGIYHFPLTNRLLTTEDGQCSSLGNCTTNWGAKNSDYAIAMHRDRDFCFGQFIWSGWDYIGEPTPYFTKNSYFGQVDTAGFPKDSYYHYQAEWTDYRENPMIHLLPYWDFNEGQQIDVRVFTNAPRAELFFNDVSLGTQSIDHGHAENLACDWQVPYKKGVLKAVAYDESGAVIATDIQSSFSDAARLVLRPDRQEIRADGEDMLFLEITTEDENGIFVANGRSRVNVNVSGPGRLIGLDNGDSTDFEQYKGTCRKLFSGRLLAIVAATAEAGDIRIDVTSPSLPPESVTIPARPSRVREGISYFERNTQNDEGKMSEIPVRKIELTCDGETHLTAEHPSATVSAKILPSNASHRDISFHAVTLKGVESNCVNIQQDGNKAVIQAAGDGTFRLTCSCTNGSEVQEVISELEFEVSGLGAATMNAYKMVNGANHTACTSEAKLSFQGGVYITAEERTRFLFEGVDFGEYGSDEIHIPIFSFEDELPIEVWLGDSETEDGICLVKDKYRAKSWYNHYQENIYTLPERIKGVQSVSIVVYPTIKMSLQGFYMTKKEKAYGQVYAVENDSITGDAFTVGKDKITDIGNNVTLEFDGMDFGEDGPKKITICGHSSIPVNTVHIRFFGEDGSEISHMAEFPESRTYQELTFPIDGFTGRGRVNFIFMPGSKFDFDWFRFSR